MSRLLEHLSFEIADNLSAIKKALLSKHITVLLSLPVRSWLKKLCHQILKQLANIKTQ